jgi:hypothetical protein
VLLDEVVEEVENLALALGQWQHARHYTQKKSESQRPRLPLNGVGWSK